MDSRATAAIDRSFKNAFAQALYSTTLVVFKRHVGTSHRGTRKMIMMSCIRTIYSFPFPLLFYTVPKRSIFVIFLGFSSTPRSCFSSLFFFYILPFLNGWVPRIFTPKHQTLRINSWDEIPFFQVYHTWWRCRFNSSSLDELSHLLDMHITVVERTQPKLQRYITLVYCVFRHILSHRRRCEVALQNCIVNPNMN